MDVSKVYNSASRAAVATWRDDASLAAMSFTHAAGAAAMCAFEQRIEEIAIAAALINAESEALVVIRPLMKQAVAEVAGQWFRDHARELRRIDGRFEPLALNFSNVSNHPLLPGHEIAALPRRRLFKTVRHGVDALGWSLGRIREAVTDRAVPKPVRMRAEKLSTLLGQQIAEKSGAHERLRAGGRAELTRTWLGIVSDAAIPPSYLMQILRIVDNTATQAFEVVT